MKKSAIVITGFIIIFSIILFYSRSTNLIRGTSDSSLHMIIASPSFNNNEPIPQKFTCDGFDSSTRLTTGKLTTGGGNINPELHIQNVPENAESLALIVDDPDATGGRTFTHWLVWNIDPKTDLVKEGSVPSKSNEGTTDFGKIGYGGPCPPRGSNPHRYFFKLYALDIALSLPSSTAKSDLESAMNGHVLAEAELVGLYARGK